MCRPEPVSCIFGLDSVACLKFQRTFLILPKNIEYSMSDVTHACFEGLTPDIMNFQGGVTSDAVKGSTVKN